jgi:hypothetical protein
MSDTPLDLWATDLGTREITTPLAILRSQASLLAQKTSGMLEGQVETTTRRDGSFVHSFYVVAPALDHYKYGLLSIRHGIGLYPATVYAPNQPELDANSEQELIECLRSALSSDETRRVVDALLAQSRSAVSA